MAVRPASVARPAPVAGRPFALGRAVEREGVFSLVMLAPGVLFLILFVAYPFFYGIFLSLQERRVASAGTFVGLANFLSQAQDAVFWQVARNTFLYTIVATLLKMIGGLAMALVMNQSFRGRNLARAFLLLPFIVPTVLSTVAWMWILDPTFSVINWSLRHSGLVKENFSWLGNKTLAMVSIIGVNTWRGLPFYGITLLAGLQTISPDLYEAAAIDGASITQRFWHITLPVLKPILIIVTMFSVIFTFSDFQLVYVLTHGGPANATHLFATYAFDIGMSAGVLGMGAAIALAMLPALALLIFPGAAVVTIGIAATYLVPQPLLFIPMADIINRLDLSNTLSAVMLTYPTLLIPFCAWLLMGYFKSVPRELEEAARIDGASRFQAMLRVVLPLCTPGLLSAGIFAFTLAQNEFLYALIFLTKSDVRTVPVGAITELIRGDVFYWGQLMAAALLGSIPVAVIYSFFVEYYVAGLTAGSVKG